MTSHRPHPSAETFLQDSKIVDVDLSAPVDPHGSQEAKCPERKQEASPQSNAPHVEGVYGACMMLALLIGKPLSYFYSVFKTRRLASKQIKKLVDEGLLAIIEVAHGRGAKLKLICPTEKAWEQVASAGMQRPAFLVQGGELHDYAARAIKAIADNNGDTVDFEVLIDTVRFDVVWHREGRPTLFVNIGVSDPQREAESLSRALTSPQPGGGELIHVGITTRFNQGVNRRLKQLQPQLFERVEYRLLGSLIKTAYIKE